MPSARVRKSKNLIGWQLARIGLAFINVPWFVTILVLLARHIGRRWMDYKILFCDIDGNIKTLLGGKVLGLVLQMIGFAFSTWAFRLVHRRVQVASLPKKRIKPFVLRAPFPRHGLGLVVALSLLYVGWLYGFTPLWNGTSFGKPQVTRHGVFTYYSQQPDLLKQVMERAEPLALRDCRMPWFKNCQSCGRKAKPVRVLLFNNLREYQENTEVFGNSGMYVPPFNLIFIPFSASPGVWDIQKVSDTLAHEFCHALTNERFSTINQKPWLNEGLATYATFCSVYGRGAFGQFQKQIAKIKAAKKAANEKWLKEQQVFWNSLRGWHPGPSKIISKPAPQLADLEAKEFMRTLDYYDSCGLLFWVSDEGRHEERLGALLEAYNQVPDLKLALACALPLRGTLAYQDAQKVYEKLCLQ